MADVTDSTPQLVVEVYVRDLERSLAFYTALGFDLVRRTGGFAVLSWAGHVLFLDEQPQLLELEGRERANVRVMVPDVDALWQRAQNAGAFVSAPIGDRSYGLRDFTVRDPDGFGLRFASWLVQEDRQSQRASMRAEKSMDNVTFLKSLYDAFGRGDIPTVLGAMSSDIKWHQAEGNPYRPSGEPWVGPDAVLQNLFMRLGGDWDGFAVHPKLFHDSGHSVVVEGRYTGTYKPTGKRMDTQFCHVWDVKNGKLTRFQQYVDTAKLVDVMGAR